MEKTALQTEIDALATSKEKGSRKGVEMAKSQSIPRVKHGDFEIEVLEIVPIVGGVEVYAKAWTLDGKRVGFGQDGSIEIERHRIFNPPILVPSGEKVVVPTGFRDFTMEVDVMVENPIEALKNEIAHTVKMAGKSDENIVDGKVGRTTTTVYSDNSNEDSMAQRTSDETFATKRAAAGESQSDASTANVVLECSATTNQFDYMGRAYAQFDTSGIPDGDTISAAVLSVYSSTTGGHLLGTSVCVDKISGISATTPATTDFNIANWAGVEQSSTRISATDMHGANSYKDFTLNATGIGNINKTGRTSFGWRFSSDFDNSAPSWVSTNYDYWVMTQHDSGSNAPKLFVTHSAGASGPANLKSLDTNLTANIKSINTNLIANVKSLDTNV